MFKAGASFHDKYMIGQHLKSGMTVDQISMMTSIRVDHVKAVVKQIKNGTIKLKGKAAYLMGQPDEEHPLEGLTAKAQENRMDQLSTENAELKAQMAEIMARLNVPEPAVAEVPADPMADTVEEEVVETTPKRKKRRVEATPDA